MAIDLPVLTFNLELQRERQDITQSDWNVIYDVIKDFVHSTLHPILCFQSITPSVESRLHSFLNSVNYTMITTHYDIKKVSHGIGIAFSNNLYTLKEIQTHRLGDVVEEIYGANDDDLNDLPPGAIDCFKWITRFMDRFAFINSVWERSTKCNHKILGLQLHRKNKVREDPFWIWTCDLPIDQDVNSVFAMTMIRIVCTRKSFYPFILTGGFNFQPDSIIYRMIRSDNSVKQVLAPQLNIETHSFSLREFDPVKDTIPLYSTFSRLNQTPDPITRIARIDGLGTVKETTDYILVSFNHKVVSSNEIDIFDTNKFDESHTLIHLPIKSMIIV